MLIPCHSLKFLDKAIQSVAAQTMSSNDFEVILVADRIETSVAAELLKNSISNYQIYESDKPGIVNALNLGLSKSKSSYVARMDEDDLMEPNRLFQQSSYLDNNMDCIVIGGQLKLINEKGESIGVSRFSNKVISRSQLLRRSPIAHPAAMFRRDRVLDVGGYREYLPEDWDLWARLWQHGRIANLRDYVLRYRIHENQLSRTAMYKHSTSRLIVGTSLYARESGFRDHPNDYEDIDGWLTETKRTLTANSIEFRKFSSNVDKESQFMLNIESNKGSKNIFKSIKSLFSSPKPLLGYVYRVASNRYYFWKTR